MSEPNSMSRSFLPSEMFESMRKIQAQLDQGMKRNCNQLTKALIAEYGEYLEAVKHNWAWWVRRDKEFTFDKSAARVESIDILHFYLGMVNDGCPIPDCVDLDEILSEVFDQPQEVYTTYINKARINLERWSRDPSEIDSLIRKEFVQ